MQGYRKESKIQLHLSHISYKSCILQERFSGFLISGEPLINAGFAAADTIALNLK